MQLSSNLESLISFVITVHFIDVCLKLLGFYVKCMTWLALRSVPFRSVIVVLTWNGEEQHLYLFVTNKTGSII